MAIFTKFAYISFFSYLLEGKIYAGTPLTLTLAIGTNMAIFTKFADITLGNLRALLS